LGKPDEKAQEYNSSAYLQTHEFTGLVHDWQKGRLTVEQRNHMKVGETLEVFCPDGSLSALVLEDMRDEEGNVITAVPHAQMIFSCKAEKQIPKAAILRRRIP